MAKAFKLAIVRARHDGVTTIPDQACLAMLMTGAHSVMRFWEETTGGYFDFLDNATSPRVDITITATATGRDVQARAAFAAIGPANLPRFTGGFNGAI